MFDRSDERVCNLIRNSSIYKWQIYPGKTIGPPRHFHTIAFKFVLPGLRELAAMTSKGIGGSSSYLQKHASCHLMRFSVERDEPVGTFRIENLERGNMENNILRKCGRVMK